MLKIVLPYNTAKNKAFLRTQTIIPINIWSHHSTPYLYNVSSILTMYYVNIPPHSADKVLPMIEKCSHHTMLRASISNQTCIFLLMYLHAKHQSHPSYLSRVIDHKPDGQNHGQTDGRQERTLNNPFTKCSVTVQACLSPRWRPKCWIILHAWTIMFIYYICKTITT